MGIHFVSIEEEMQGVNAIPNIRCHFSITYPNAEIVLSSKVSKLQEMTANEPE